MKCLVTGSSGFLGSVLVPKLIDAGHDVHVFDIKNDSLDDVRNADSCRHAVQENDAIIHLAAIVGDAACMKDPNLAFETNVQGTENLMRYANGKRFIYSSTASVYGIKMGIVDENSIPEPISTYGQTKLEAETFLKDKAIIFRLGTMYGWSPRMRYDLVVNTFIKNAKEKGKMRVFGGMQYRPLVHVGDVADMIVKSLKTEKKGIYNLAYGNYTIYQIAMMIQGKLNEMGIKTTVDLETGIKDRRNYEVSCEKAIEELGWKPKRDIPYAVEEIWERIK